MLNTLDLITLRTLLRKLHKTAHEVCEPIAIACNDRGICCDEECPNPSLYCCDCEIEEIINGINKELGNEGE